MKKVWYNVWFKDSHAWHSAQSAIDTVNFSSLEDAKNCAYLLGVNKEIREIKIKSFTEEVVETRIIKSKLEALKEELVYLSELKECTESLWDLYSSGPLKDSGKVSCTGISLNNINSTIINVKKQIEELSNKK
jgi:hypothetical protein